MSIHKIFAQNLREECRRFGSIAEVCRGCGINRQQFNKYLSGAILPNGRTLRRLCGFLGIDDAKLFAAAPIGGEQQTALLKVPGDNAFPSELSTLGGACRQPALSAPSEEMAEGTYFCYFPMEGFPNFLIRSVIKTRLIGRHMSFTRHTHMRSLSSSGEANPAGKHHGIVVDDTSAIVMLGRNANPPHNITSIYLRKGPMYGLKIRTGLAFARGVSTPFACRACLESLGTSRGALRAAMKQAGVIGIDDASVSAAVRNAMSQPIELDNGLLGLPALEKLLDMRIRG